MKTQRGYTLIETLVAMLILVMLSASGLYGWQYWQQSQRLWQTASQARDYLLYLREDANWHNRDHSISLIREGTLWCLVSSVAGANTCHGSSPLVFVPRWPEVEMSDLTPSLAFFGLRNTLLIAIAINTSSREKPCSFTGILLFLLADKAGVFPTAKPPATTRPLSF